MHNGAIFVYFFVQFSFKKAGAYSAGKHSNIFCRSKDIKLTVNEAPGGVVEISESALPPDVANMRDGVVGQRLRFFRRAGTGGHRPEKREQDESDKTGNEWRSGAATRVCPGPAHWSPAIARNGRQLQ